MEISPITSKWAEYNPCEFVPKYTVNRYDDSRGNRFYYFTDDFEQTHCAAGITTWLGKVMPESPFITDWKIKFGDKWRTVLQLTADYGTMMHVCFGHMMIQNEHPPEEYINEAKSILQQLNKFDKNYVTKTIDDNIVSFQRFRDEYNLRPLLVEALLVCKSVNGDYYCLTQDLLAEIDNTIKTKVEYQDGVYSKGKNKGEPRMVTDTQTETRTEVVCIDFKSNSAAKDKKTFFDSNKYQLMGTAKAVEQNFGVKVDRLFNFSPNNWRSDVGDYTFFEWKLTERDHEIFNLYEVLASKLGAFTPSGNIGVYNKFKNGMKFTEMYEKYDYLEFVGKMNEQKSLMSLGDI